MPFPKSRRQASKRSLSVIPTTKTGSPWVESYLWATTTPVIQGQPPQKTHVCGVMPFNLLQKFCQYVSQRFRLHTSTNGVTAKLWLSGKPTPWPTVKIMIFRWHIKTLLAWTVHDIDTSKTIKLFFSGSPYWHNFRQHRPENITKSLCEKGIEQTNVVTLQLFDVQVNSLKEIQPRLFLSSVENYSIAPNLELTKIYFRQKFFTTSCYRRINLWNHPFLKH
jgi:hypothetical protein